MTTASVVQHLENERLRPTPPAPNETLEGLFRQLLDVISAECRRKGWLK